MPHTLSLLANTELPYFGYNLSNVPIGGGVFDFRNKKPDENLDGLCDPLVPIENDILTRPMYFNLGWTKDSRLFLRQPALLHLKTFNQNLRAMTNWQIRVTDPFRPWTVQQKGFCWGIEQVIKNRDEITLAAFKKLLKNACEGKTDQQTIAQLEKYIWEADIFFSYVIPKKYDAKNFPKKLSPTIITAAANMELIDLPLDPYGITCHITGGIADIEFVDSKGKLVNMGVPVDHQGLESVFTFMEDRVAPLLEQECKSQNLITKEQRQNFYLKAIQKKPALQAYLKSCGHDPQKMLASPEYFQETWYEIQRNRRIVGHIAFELGIIFDGWESWHVVFNDARGGVRSKRSGIISGSGEMAVHLGQKECAWGNATKLWEKL